MRLCVLFGAACVGGLRCLLFDIAVMFVVLWLCVFVCVVCFCLRCVIEVSVCGLFVMVFVFVFAVVCLFCLCLWFVIEVCVCVDCYIVCLSVCVCVLRNFVCFCLGLKFVV